MAQNAGNQQLILLAFHVWEILSEKGVLKFPKRSRILKNVTSSASSEIRHHTAKIEKY